MSFLEGLGKVFRMDIAERLYSYVQTAEEELSGPGDLLGRVGVLAGR